MLSDDDDESYPRIRPVKLPRHSSPSASSEFDSSSWNGLSTDDEEIIEEDMNEEQFGLDALLKDGMSGDKTYVHFPNLPLTM